jgi:hypothetical protein
MKKPQDVDWRGNIMRAVQKTMQEFPANDALPHEERKALSYNRLQHFAISLSGIMNCDDVVVSSAIMALVEAEFTKEARGEDD